MAPALKEQISSKHVGDIFTVREDNIYRIFLVEGFRIKGVWMRM